MTQITSRVSDDVRVSLDERKLADLRAAYDRNAMRAVMSDAFIRRYPPLADWCRGIDSTFYAGSTPMAPANRERCLVAMLACLGASVPLGIHIYWGLMEGLSLDEMTAIVSLAGCYGGVPRLVTSFAVMEVVGSTLQALDEQGPMDPERVLDALVPALSARAGR